jgi:uncharacterized membrane protein
MVATVVVSICVIVYYSACIMIVMKLNIPNIIKITILIISIIVTAIIIMVLIERIKEIEGGEEDDLGKY